jgi:hypothetical protein
MGIEFSDEKHNKAFSAPEQKKSCSFRLKILFVLCSSASTTLFELLLTSVVVNNYFFVLQQIRYENEDPAVRFTEAQLTEIRKTTLSKINCENLDIPGDMQRAMFDLPSNFL